MRASPVMFAYKLHPRVGHIALHLGPVHLERVLELGKLSAVRSATNMNTHEMITTTHVMITNMHEMISNMHEMITNTLTEWFNIIGGWKQRTDLGENLVIFMNKLALVLDLGPLQV
jgi:hypothetical protein